MAKFDLRADGVYILAGDEWEKVCSSLRVVALTRDHESDNWGRLVQWDDADGKPHEKIIHHSSLAVGNKDVLTQLLAGGLAIEQNKRDSVIEYILSQSPAQRLTIALHTGWHGHAFVLPDAVIEPDNSSDEIRFAPSVPMGEHGYGVAGSADDWKREVGALCRSNSRLTFGISMAFCTPALEMLGEDGWGAHIHGASSTGKTTVLTASGSVWGGGKNGFLKSWRTTSNALENVAAAHNDCFLPLDELAMLDAKEADRVPYLLATGKSKARMNADSSGQRHKEWRLCFLSTGEVTAGQQAESVGARTRGGAEARMVNIPADAGKGMGAFEDLHGRRDAAQFAVTLREAALKFYGAVGREWVRLLITDRVVYTELLRDYILEFERDHMPQDAAPEVGRVVHHFAVIAAAGELATLFDLTGLELHEAEWACAECLRAWLESRGGAKAGHDASEMLAQVRHFLQSHQADFCRLPENPISGAPRVYRPVGYTRASDSSPVYFVQGEIFKREACKGYDHRQVLATLELARHLEHDSDRRDKQLEIRPGERARFYAIRHSLLTNGDNDGE